MIKGNLLSKYYLATPIFLFAEIVSGMNFRVTLPWSGDFQTYLYLAACFIIGGFFLKNEKHLNLFTLIESSVNFFMLLKSVYLPIFVMANNLNETSINKIGIENNVHFIIVGFFLLYAFYTNPFLKKNP